VTGKTKVFIIFLNTVIIIFSLQSQETVKHYLEWYTVLGGKCITNPIINEKGNVFFLCDDRNLYTVSSSGSVLSKTYTEKKPIPVLTAIKDGNMLTGLTGGALIFINPSGRMVWKYEKEGDGNQLFSLEGPNGIVYLFSSCGTMTAVTPGGFLLWEHAFSKEIILSPILDSSGRILIPLKNNTIQIVTLDGIILSPIVLNKRITSLACDSSGIIYAGMKTGELITIESDIPKDLINLAEHSINRLIWTNDFTAGILSNGEAFFVSNDDYTVYNWKLKNSKITGMVSVNNDSFFICTDDGKMQIVQHQNGEIRLRWEYLTDMPSTLMYPVTDGNGAVYVTASNWAVYKVAIPVMDYLGWKNYRSDSHLSGWAPGKIKIRHDPWDPPLEYFFLLNQAKSDSEQEKLTVISTIRKRMNESDFRINRKYYAEILRYLFTELWKKDTERRLGSKDFPRVRGEAAYLLGLIGGNDERKTLINYAGYEYDGLAKQGILRGFAALRRDRNFAVSIQIKGFIENEIKKSVPSNEIASAAISAAWAIFSYHGNSHTENIITILMMIIQNGFNKETRKSALDIIREIQKY